MGSFQFRHGMKIKTNITLKKILEGEAKMAKYFRSNGTSLENTLIAYQKKPLKIQESFLV